MTPKETESSGHGTKLLLAFLAIYLIWGTTYLAMRVAVQTVPPFMLAATRFLVAGWILFAILKLRRVPTPVVAQWKAASLVGSLLFLGGNGLVIWAVQEIPSGIAALVIATTPIWMTLFDWAFFGGPRLGKKVTGGILLGLVGIVLLMQPDKILAGQSSLNLYYMLALVLAPLFWCFGSLYSRNANLPSNPFMANATEMMCGGAVLLIVSLAMGEARQFSLADVAPQAWAGLLYLTLFGSMIALTAYAWLLKNAPAAKIATYSYVNPVIAVFLGWLILNETIDLQTIVAVVVILAGVIVIISDRYRKPDQQDQPMDGLEQDVNRAGVSVAPSKAAEPANAGGSNLPRPNTTDVTETVPADTAADDPSDQEREFHITN